LTKTKLIDDLDEKMKNNKMICIEPTRCAVVAFRDIGINLSTGGDWKHEMPVPPQSVMSNIMFKEGKKMFEKLHPDDDRY